MTCRFRFHLNPLNHKKFTILTDRIERNERSDLHFQHHIININENDSNYFTA